MDKAKNAFRLCLSRDGITLSRKERPMLCKNLAVSVKHHRFDKIIGRATGFRILANLISDSQPLLLFTMIQQPLVKMEDFYRTFAPTRSLFDVPSTPLQVSPSGELIRNRVKITGCRATVIPSLPTEGKSSVHTGHCPRQPISVGGRKDEKADKSRESQETCLQRIDKRFREMKHSQA